MAAVVVLSFIAIMLGLWAVLEIRKLRKGLNKKKTGRKPNNANKK